MSCDMNTTTFLSRTRRSFVVSRADSENNQDQTDTFNDYRGTGPPPPPAGSPGDIYIDKSAAIIYVRLPKRWTSWPGLPNNRSSALAHPNHPELFLWYSPKKNRITWLPRSKMKKLSSSERDIISRILSAEAESAQSTSLKRKEVEPSPLDDDQTHLKKARTTPAHEAGSEALPTPPPQALAWVRCKERESEGATSTAPIVIAPEPTETAPPLPRLIPRPSLSSFISEKPSSITPTPKEQRCTPPLVVKNFLYSNGTRWQENDHSSTAVIPSSTDTRRAPIMVVDSDDEFANCTSAPLMEKLAGPVPPNIHPPSPPLPNVPISDSPSPEKGTPLTRSEVDANESIRQDSTSPHSSIHPVPPSPNPATLSISPSIAAPPPPKLPLPSVPVSNSATGNSFVPVPAADPPASFDSAAFVAARISSMRLEIDALRKANFTLIREQTTTEKERDSLAQQRDTLARQTDTLMNTQTNLYHKIGVLALTVDTFKVATLALKTQNGRLRNRNKDLNGERERFVRERERLVEGYEALLRQNDQLKRGNEMLVLGMNSLAVANKNLEAAKARLEKERDALKLGNELLASSVRACREDHIPNTSQRNANAENQNLGLEEGYLGNIDMTLSTHQHSECEPVQMSTVLVTEEDYSSTDELNLKSPPEHPMPENHLQINVELGEPMIENISQLDGSVPLAILDLINNSPPLIAVSLTAPNPTPGVPLSSHRNLMQIHLEVLWTYCEGASYIACNPCASMDTPPFEVPLTTSLKDLTSHSEDLHADFCDAILAKTKGMTDEQIREWWLNDTDE
ncbi:hypothetical protein R3P38DRAFT_3067932 [Favolaschia claudopus]|uniref:Uncharacterized protein n=1 Tax=Favolaschia claudopus TaxID=2862362 RepID=A0AAW0A178_9AGAR